MLADSNPECPSSLHLPSLFLFHPEPPESTSIYALKVWKSRISRRKRRAMRRRLYQKKSALSPCRIPSPSILMPRSVPSSPHTMSIRHDEDTEMQGPSDIALPPTAHLLANQGSADLFLIERYHGASPPDSPAASSVSPPEPNAEASRACREEVKRLSLQLSDLQEDGGEVFNNLIAQWDAQIANPEVYIETFAPLIRFCHQVSEETVQPPEDFRPLPTGLPSLQQYSQRVSLRIRVARNLKCFPLPSRMSLEDRLCLLASVREALRETESGSFFTLSDCSDEEKDVLVRKRVLFPPPSNYFTSAGINRHWPEGRGGLISDDEVVRVWVGEEDHLRIQVLSDSEDFPSLFSRLSSVLSQLEHRLCDKLTDRLNREGGGVFVWEKEFGFITSCPTNVKTGMRASVLCALPLFSHCVTQWANCLGLQVRGARGEASGVGSDGVVDLSPRQRFRISENEVLCSLVTSTQAPLPSSHTVSPNLKDGAHLLPVHLFSSQSEEQLSDEGVDSEGRLLEGEGGLPPDSGSETSGIREGQEEGEVGEGFSAYAESEESVNRRKGDEGGAGSVSSLIVSADRQSRTSESREKERKEKAGNGFPLDEALDAASGMMKEKEEGDDSDC
uniref:Phosphagen kinase C-terminal domain-containing protein n=1 Tax=Chromera velia CCMP2878 TaxID=1169474 RepID=A0A0G4GDJ7_9ALVE|eukprot:Cvel_613.t1-p1 / transcript=Cvel_613.t1 / gene=Cvel_613 / organism=Chromera_velia_CCMP2878 / gene_product=Arginine kinase, putative / transcript_product=Arginine kinase, putative / location=Cvel_scaffold19:20082-22288(+) / protein_length=616 / sequence_SO=supercontig / SO=protein_coding / is_pseudo=false